MESSLSETHKIPSIPEIEGVLPVDEREPFEKHFRENKVLHQLRKQLRRRKSDSDTTQAEDPDRYEPQRLTRKICWQYDVNAHKVPLLRRPYI
jgi:hypothetical protein